MRLRGQATGTNDDIMFVQRFHQGSQVFNRISQISIHKHQTLFYSTLKTVAYGMPFAAIFREDFNLGVFHRAKALAECNACSILRAVIHNNNV
jgi:hypothetical protein